MPDLSSSGATAASPRPLRRLIALWSGLYPAVLATLLAGGCAFQARPVIQAPALFAECERLFDEVDDAIDRAGARDHGPVPIEGFPWLRADRFLASFANEKIGMDAFPAWVERLGELDLIAREFELRNAGAYVAGWEAEKLGEELTRCRTQLQDDLLADPGLRARLMAAVQVPDDYVTTWRIVGLYPFTAPFVSLGIRRWHEETAQMFDMALDDLPVTGDLRRWRIARPEAASAFAPSYDPLGIPDPGDAALQALLRRHAPTWEVDVASDDDRIGTPESGAQAMVSTQSATQYHYVSYTRFGRRILLQLNYVIWFPARSGDDIYAGNIDGITWRVTLGPDGEPWLYDSIHNCGCYHLYFPTAHLRLRDDLPGVGFEPPLAPQQAPEPPLVIRIDSGRHYIQRVYRATETAEGYRAGTTPLIEADYNQLRSLPTDHGHRSFFGAFGLVPGSERGERFLLWPMGVRSPGAMRQRGHHPVAFVGRRHFDEPRLIEKLFLETVR